MILSIVFLAGGFVAGVLVGRKNKSGVENALSAARVELATLKAKV